MSVSSLIRQGLGSTTSDLVRLGLGSGVAPSSAVGPIITLGLNYTPSDIIRLGLGSGASGTTFDAAPSSALSLAGALGIAGDIAFVGGGAVVWDFAAIADLPTIAGVLGITGDVAFSSLVTFDVAPTAPVAVSGTAAVAAPTLQAVSTTAAEVWGYVMANGQTAEANVLAILEATAGALEGSLTMPAMLRIMLAALSGKTTGVGTDTEAYLSADGSKARITATFDASSNRATVSLDGTE